MKNVTNEYEFIVLVNGKPITEYNHQNQVFIEGRKGSTYELLCRNKTGKRALFVPTVDGLSVIDGKPGRIDSSGYVIDAYGEVRIPGWKVDGKTAAKFEFNAMDKSYSAQIGQGETNVGVIGCRVFREKDRPVPKIIHHTFLPDASPLRSRRINADAPWNPPLYGGGGNVFNNMSESWGVGAVTSSLTASSAIGAMAETQSINQTQAVDEQIGTGFGAATEFATQMVEFERANDKQPDCQFAVFYDTKKGLERRGVIVRRGSDTPNPFPGDAGCVPPPGWRK